MYRAIGKPVDRASMVDDLFVSSKMRTTSKLLNMSPTQGRLIDLIKKVASDRQSAEWATSTTPAFLSSQRCVRTDSEDVVGVSEETNTGDHDGADMVPAKGCFAKNKSVSHSVQLSLDGHSSVDVLYLSECEPSALVGVCYVGIVVMEVVKGRVASSSLGRHCAAVLL